MKICPVCGKQYQDEETSFCLEDGAVLTTDTGQTLILSAKDDAETKASFKFSTNGENGTLISLQNLKVHYKIGGGLFKETQIVKAVDGVSFDIKKGETLGLVGESGCGKSTLGKAILRLVEPTDGKILYQNKNLVDDKTSVESVSKIMRIAGLATVIFAIFFALAFVFRSGMSSRLTIGFLILFGISVVALLASWLRKQMLNLFSEQKMREQRKHLQMIFQDPYASLNPRMNVGQIIGEPMRTFNLQRGKSADERVEELMETVGMSRRFMRRYPHEFSGGQRQRIGIARALAVDPEFIVADEPISALDVSIQAQIMNLMERLQAEKNLTYLFISHDLRAVRHLSDRVAVMYLGKIVELADGKEIYREPLMPYSKALISAVPVPDPEIEAKRERIILKGDVPSPINPPSGCHFHTRCPFAIDACKQIVPQLVEIKPRHYAACIRINAEKPYIEENEKEGLGAIGN